MICYAVQLDGNLIPCITAMAWTSRAEAEKTASACGGRVVEVSIVRIEPQKAIDAWCRWFSESLDAGRDYHGSEMDLFEAFGCTTQPFDK